MDVVYKSLNTEGINSQLDIDINRWIIFVVEEYCSFVNKSSLEIYPLMVYKNVITELEKDYKLLHSMSTSYMNEYVDVLLNE